MSVAQGRSELTADRIAADKKQESKSKGYQLVCDLTLKGPQAEDLLVVQTITNVDTSSKAPIVLATSSDERADEGARAFYSKNSATGLEAKIRFSKVGDKKAATLSLELKGTEIVFGYSTATLRGDAFDFEPRSLTANLGGDELSYRTAKDVYTEAEVSCTNKAARN